MEIMNFYQKFLVAVKKAEKQFRLQATKAGEAGFKPSQAWGRWVIS